jgi:hypothetical protein
MGIFAKKTGRQARPTRPMLTDYQEYVEALEKRDRIATNLEDAKRRYQNALNAENSYYYMRLDDQAEEVLGGADAGELARRPDIASEGNKSACRVEMRILTTALKEAEERLKRQRQETSQEISKELAGEFRGLIEREITAVEALLKVAGEEREFFEHFFLHDIRVCYADDLQHNLILIREHFAGRLEEWLGIARKFVSRPGTDPELGG